MNRGGLRRRETGVHVAPVVTPNFQASSIGAEDVYSGQRGYERLSYGGVVMLRLKRPLIGVRVLARYMVTWHVAYTSR
jgi:hypothetical protein